MSEPTNEAVRVERRDHVMIITINRPEARNAVNRAVRDGIGLAMEEAERDPDVRVVILTGAGDKAFCAGADLKSLAGLATDEPARESPARASEWGWAGYVKHHISKPTIAAVNGAAMGGGTELTLASDLAVASETATFGLPEVKRGIYAAAGGAFRIAQALPPKVAMEILLTGDAITAQRALELGLINQVVPQKEVLNAALALAERIAVNAPLSVQASKRIARGIVDGVIADEEELWKRASELGRVAMRSEDAKEGPLAFAEKRAPVWKGH
jgi:crotonobetainyl-CoA hydratase